MRVWLPAAETPRASIVYLFVLHRRCVFDDAVDAAEVTCSSGRSFVTVTLASIRVVQLAAAV